MSGAVNPIEFYRNHREEVEILADPRAAFLLSYIGLLGTASSIQLLEDLHWPKGDLEALWSKLHSGGFITSDLAGQGGDAIRLSAAGKRILKLIESPTSQGTAKNTGVSQEKNSVFRRIFPSPSRRTIEQSPSSPPPARAATALATESAVNSLYVASRAEAYGLTLAEFEATLEQVAAKYAPGATFQEKMKLWKELRLEELALARACVAGHEFAWREFLTRYREKLYDIARGITKEDSSGRELADSLYADLYGMTEKEGRRVSRLSFYMGRGSLEGWLRTVLAQEFVNRYRKQKRLVSLEEETEEGVQFASTESFSGTAVDRRLGEATDEALHRLPPEDRLILAGYYLDDRTLTEIGRMLGVHESTVSRRLEKLLKGLRKQVLAGLQARGMKRGQAEEALEVDVRFLTVDVRRRLQETRLRAFQEDKGSN